MHYKSPRIRVSKMMAKISAKGQITIPKEIRKALGVEPGDRLAFSIEGGKTVVYPVTGSLLDLRGSLKPKKIPEDLEKIRKEVKKSVARRAIEPGSLSGFDVSPGCCEFTRKIDSS
jgi:antitoxin PrlF